ncbi:DnaJ protein, putative [Plasmodium knowlesi strain H]|uniref:DnaJ protein, putative n=3 Tax=Plasmodium knowlesi TaxID=5850 RepID=A0A5K1UUZ7_PLAKH|nr:DnaJ protein, putative [Plasmodium knowlesi strain H]OTN68727.1 putative DNAJ protein [Plasmodium knowlesi]CAA9986205.1 DnaJ protein, putative [Plasmodium knowlesi strain H]SBO25409.1 DnaJ protein, putative [Plasmodium knowlesi strain H]SBO27697.1 DnaJ protein, putative [Plasmodium knowlesi strain H]VVS75679.1 DnaJ protein, putative [Plasmodium knowlesi strain H]|eukprot:XP_002257615.1 DNAJ protein, putative [Plasmodium knowlesi strain H]
MSNWGGFFGDYGNWFTSPGNHIATGNVGTHNVDTNMSTNLAAAAATANNSSASSFFEDNLDPRIRDGGKNSTSIGGNPHDKSRHKYKFKYSRKDRSDERSRSGRMDNGYRDHSSSSGSREPGSDRESRVKREKLKEKKGDRKEEMGSANNPIGVGSCAHPCGSAQEAFSSGGSVPSGASPIGATPIGASRSSSGESIGGFFSTLGLGNLFSNLENRTFCNEYKTGYCLDEEAKKVLQKDGDSSSKNSSSKKSSKIGIGLDGKGVFNSESPEGNPICVDTTYYDILNVKPTATFSEIKSSYYKLALKWHPDKKGDDPEAKVKFQKINEAYQVLSDSERRADYNKYGLNATKDMVVIDPSLLFMMLYSSDELSDYVGTLRVAFFIKLAFECNSTIEDIQTQGGKMFSEMEVEQSKREIELALLLRKRLQPYVDGDTKWVERMEKEISDLLDSSFSSSILESIGWNYRNSASSFIAEVTTLWGMGATLPNIQAQKRSVQNNFGLATSLISTFFTMQKMVAYNEMNDSLEGADLGEEAKVISGGKVNCEENKLQKEKIQDNGSGNVRDNASAGYSSEGYSGADHLGGKTAGGNFTHKVADKFSDFFGEKRKEKKKQKKEDMEGAEGITQPSRSSTELVDDGIPQSQQTHDDDTSKRKTCQKKDMDREAYLEKKNNEAFAIIIKNVLKVVLWDIESTVRKVAEKVLRDEGVSIETRLQRAKALKLLGKIMLRLSKTKKDMSDSKEFDVNQLFESVILKVAQKAAAEEEAASRREDEDFFKRESY